MVQRIKILDSLISPKQVTLSGNSYILSFKFNASDSNWYIVLDTPTEQNIYAGLRGSPIRTSLSQGSTTEGCPEVFGALESRGMQLR